MRQGREVIVQTARVAVITLAACACATAGLACGLVALWLYVLPHVGPVVAPLIVAGVLFALALGLMMAQRFGFRRRQALLPVDAPPAVLLEEASRLVRDHKGTVLMAALVAGLVAGRNDT